MSSLCVSWGKKHLEAWLRPSVAAVKCRCGQVPLRSSAAAVKCRCGQVPLRSAKKIWAPPLENFRPPLGEAKGGPRPLLERKSV